MAIYHCSIRNFSKCNGRSAVEKGAYIDGQQEEYNELTHERYHHRLKDPQEVRYSEMMFRDEDEEMTRHDFWTDRERRAGRQTYAREFEVAMPRELSFEEQQQLARDYASSFFKDGSTGAQISIHDKGDGNPHAHIICDVPERPKTSKGYVCRLKDDPTQERIYKNVKDIPDEWERVPLLDKEGNIRTSKGRIQYKRENTLFRERDYYKGVRQRWADYANAAIDRHAERTGEAIEHIDHRSLRDQGIIREPFNMSHGEYLHTVKLDNIRVDHTAEELTNKIKESEGLIASYKQQLEQFLAEVKEIAYDYKQRAAGTIEEYLERARAAINSSRTRRRESEVSRRESPTTKYIERTRSTSTRLQTKGDGLQRAKGAVQKGKPIARRVINGAEKIVQGIDRLSEPTQTYGDNER